MPVRQEREKMKLREKFFKIKKLKNRQAARQQISM